MFAAHTDGKNDMLHHNTASTMTLLTGCIAVWASVNAAGGCLTKNAVSVEKLSSARSLVMRVEFKNNSLLKR